MCGVLVCACTGAPEKVVMIGGKRLAGFKAVGDHFKSIMKASVCACMCLHSIQVTLLHALTGDLDISLAHLLALDHIVTHALPHTYAQTLPRTFKLQPSSYINLSCVHMGLIVNACVCIYPTHSRSLSTPR